VVQTLTRRQWVWVVAVTAVLAGLVGALVGVAIGVTTQKTVIEKFFPNQSVLANPSPGDIQAVLAQVEPAVVSINTTQVRTGNSGQLIEGAGSGMVVTPSGEVLTNDHVVAGATSVQVTLFGQTKEYSARVVGTDPSQDLALVQLSGVVNLPTVHLGNSSSLRVGDAVLAIGNALALQGGPTVTNGIVSATDRSLTAQGEFSNASENLSGLIQTNAAINPGNSGGPLVDSRGRVIGMNTAVAESSAGNAPAQNIGFAIAIDSIKDKLPGLREGGSGGAGGGTRASTLPSNQAYIGVIIVTVTPQLAKTDHLTPTAGALVQGLDATGPAKKAGIKVNDVIVTIGGTPITSASDLATVLHRHHPGETVPIGVYRGPTPMTIQVTLARQP
jgi:S1-C subfamily serine protease